jgi:hypothetical protein
MLDSNGFQFILILAVRAMTESCSRLGLKDKVWESMDALQAEEHFEAELDLDKATRKQYFEVVYHDKDTEAFDCCAEIGWIEIEV